jgi:hypothetical protein
MKECSSGSSFRPGIAPKEMEPARLAAARPGKLDRYVRTKRVGSSQWQQTDPKRSL